MTRLFTAVLALLLALTAPVAHASRSTDMVSPSDVALAGPGGAPLDGAATRAAILAGAAEKGWVVDSEEPGIVRLRTLVRSKHTVVVAAHYTPGQVRIEYVDSVEMNHKVRRDGTVRIHPNYMVWRGWLEDAVRGAAARG